MGFDDDTEKVVGPCSECGAPAIRLIACDAPPHSALRNECLWSGDHEDPLWRYCARTGRFFARVRYG